MKFEIYDQKSLNFVELNTTGNNFQYVRCDPESRYIDTSLFNLFAESFEKANKLYECYGATKFNTRYIVPLRNRLLINLTILQKIQTLADFQKHISSKVQGKEFLLSLVSQDKTWTDRWSLYLEKIIKINREILEIVDFCIDEDRILWVIGY
jgi:hypothetical protein